MFRVHLLACVQGRGVWAIFERLIAAVGNLESTNEGKHKRKTEAPGQTCEGGLITASRLV